MNRLHKFTVALAALATVATGLAWADNHLNSDLADTQWRLVKIMEMDDSTHVPNDPAKYTLAFAADGSVAIQADCNRGSGSWTSTKARQLQFGPIAATQALCGPDSISEVYLAQFQWVRS